MEKHMIVVNDQHKYYMMKMDNLYRLIKVLQSLDDLVNKQQLMEEFVQVLQQKPNVENAANKKNEFSIKK
jgi:hypothetical protein